VLEVLSGVLVIEFAERYDVAWHTVHWWRYAARVGISSSMTELRHHSTTQLLSRPQADLDPAGKLLFPAGSAAPELTVSSLRGLRPGMP
jgi:hypothetical protein